MNMPESNEISRFHALLEPWVQSQPDQPALRDAHVAYSYAQLWKTSQDAAQQLRAWGVRAGDRVLVVGENCAAACVIALAASRLDAWVCIVNARLSPAEIDNIAAHATPRRIFFTTQVSDDALRHAQRLGAEACDWAGVGQLHLGPLNAQAQAEPCHAQAAEQVAALIYTSGTSGAPKGVMLTHANLAFIANTNVRGLVSGDVVYGVLPMAHIVGLSTQFLGALAAGATVVLESRFTPEGLAGALRAGATVFTGVPAMYARLLDWLRTRQQALQAPRLRLIGVAGSPLTPELKASVEAQFQLPLLNGYGLTETAPTIAQVRAQAPRNDCAVGPPIPGVQVRIVNPQGEDLPAGAAGELWVRGPNVMKGYYHDDAQTRQVINAQGWFNTGDMARLEGDGALHIAGRTKELIIRSGFNVYPLEVEQVINAFPGIVQSAVVGRTVGHNEEVIAYVEVPAGRQIDEQALRQHLREHLSPYKQPAEIHFMEQLPAAPTGKLLKNVLKQMAGQAPQTRP
ncbi:MAG: AMP-binding protein [Proteobacteria bacterium]|nr:AMP-binding protein [Pseudomonadota bacterium]